MRSDVREFIRTRWFFTLSRLLVIFTPVFAMGWFIAHVDGPAQGEILDRLGRVEGNIYPVSSILLMLILASQFVVLISLAFYFKDIFSAVKNPKTEGWNLLAGSLLVIIVIVLVTYLANAINAMAGVRATFLEVENLFEIARYLALIVFMLFLTTDFALLCSQRIQLADLVAAGREDEKRKVEEAKNDVQLSELSIWLVDVPCVALSATAVWFLHSMETSQIAQQFRDVDFDPHNLYVDLPSATARLFGHGFDAGMIAALLLLSQISFAFVRLRWEVRDHAIKTQFGITDREA